MRGAEQQRGLTAGSTGGSVSGGGPTWLFGCCRAAAAVGVLLLVACGPTGGPHVAIEPIVVDAEVAVADRTVADGPGSGRGGVASAPRSDPPASFEVPAAEPGGGPGGTEGSAGPTDGSAAELSAVDVTVIPEVITEAYVDAVLAELEARYAVALEAFLAAGQPTLAVTDNLGAAFTEAQYAFRLQEFISLWAERPEYFVPLEEIRPRTHEVVAIHATGEACVWVETVLDVSGLVRERPGLTSFVQLGPPDVERPVSLNPTPWVIVSMPLGDPDELREWDPCR